MGKWSDKAIMENLDAAVEFVATSAERAGFGGLGLNRIRLAGEEILVNIIHYAYPDKTGLMEIECTDNPDPAGLRITVSDSGIPFDPLSCAPKATTRLPVEDRSIGGLGVHMVRSVMNEMSYRYTNGKNVLTLVKYLD